MHAAIGDRAPETTQPEPRANSAADMQIVIHNQNDAYNGFLNRLLRGSTNPYIDRAMIFTAANQYIFHSHRKLGESSALHRV
jgi:hypothetical protein